MAGITPDVDEWNAVLAKLEDFLARLAQAEDFTAEMDGRQQVVESTLPTHDSRVKALESWRGSADATMVVAEKTALENKAGIVALQLADTSIINRLKPLETWKTQVDGRLNGLEAKDALQANQITSLQSSNAQNSARIESALGIANRANDGLNSLTKTVQELSTKLSSFLSDVTATAAGLAALEIRVKALEDRVLVAQEPTEPQEPTV